MKHFFKNNLLLIIVTIFVIIIIVKLIRHFKNKMLSNVSKPLQLKEHFYSPIEQTIKTQQNATTRNIYYIKLLKNNKILICEYESGSYSWYTNLWTINFNSNTIITSKKTLLSNKNYETICAADYNNNDVLFGNDNGKLSLYSVQNQKTTTYDHGFSSIVTIKGIFVLKDKKIITFHGGSIFSINGSILHWDLTATKATKIEHLNANYYKMIHLNEDWVACWGINTKMNMDMDVKTNFIIKFVKNDKTIKSAQIPLSKTTYAMMHGPSQACTIWIINDIAKISGNKIVIGGEYDDLYKTKISNKQSIEIFSYSDLNKATITLQSIKIIALQTGYNIREIRYFKNSNIMTYTIKEDNKIKLYDLTNDKHLSELTSLTSSGSTNNNKIDNDNSGHLLVGLNKNLKLYKFKDLYKFILTASDFDDLKATKSILTTLNSKYLLNYNKITSNSFVDFLKLTKYVIPPSVTTIEPSAFKNCPKLKLYIPFHLIYKQLETSGTGLSADKLIGKHLVENTNQIYIYNNIIFKIISATDDSNGVDKKIVYTKSNGNFTDKDGKERNYADSLILKQGDSVVIKNQIKQIKTVGSSSGNVKEKFFTVNRTNLPSNSDLLGLLVYRQISINENSMIMNLYRKNTVEIAILKEALTTTTSTTIKSLTTTTRTFKKQKEYKIGSEIITISNITIGYMGTKMLQYKDFSLDTWTKTEMDNVLGTSWPKNLNVVHKQNSNTFMKLINNHITSTTSLTGWSNGFPYVPNDDQNPDNCRIYTIDMVAKADTTFYVIAKNWTFISFDSNYPYFSRMATQIIDLKTGDYYVTAHGYPDYARNNSAENGRKYPLPTSVSNNNSGYKKQGLGRIKIQNFSTTQGVPLKKDNHYRIYWIVYFNCYNYYEGSGYGFGWQTSPQQATISGSSHAGFNYENIKTTTAAGGISKWNTSYDTNDKIFFYKKGTFYNNQLTVTRGANATNHAKDTKIHASVNKLPKFVVNTKTISSGETPNTLDMCVPRTLSFTCSTGSGTACKTCASSKKIKNNQCATCNTNHYLSKNDVSKITISGIPSKTDSIAGSSFNLTQFNGDYFQKNDNLYIFEKKDDSGSGNIIGKYSYYRDSTASNIWYITDQAPGIGKVIKHTDNSDSGSADTWQYYTSSGGLSSSPLSGVNKSQIDIANGLGAKDSYTCKPLPSGYKLKSGYDGYVPYKCDKGASSTKCQICKIPRTKDNDCGISNWNSSIDYYRGDIVKSGTPIKYYKSKMYNKNKIPPNSSYWSDQGSSLKACNSGYKYISSSSSCGICPVGTKEEEDSCTPCTYGKYSSAGSTSCTGWKNCPPGKGRKSFYLETVLTKNSDIIQIKNMTSNTITYFKKGEKILVDPNKNDKFTVTTGTVYLDSWSATKDGTYSTDFSTIPSSSTLFFKTKKSSDNKLANANQNKTVKLHYSREYKIKDIDCMSCPVNSAYNNSNSKSFCNQLAKCGEGKGMFGATSTNAGSCGDCFYPKYNDNKNYTCQNSTSPTPSNSKGDLNPAANYMSDIQIYSNGNIIINTIKSHDYKVGDEIYIENIQKNDQNITLLNNHKYTIKQIYRPTIQTDDDKKFMINYGETLKADGSGGSGLLYSSTRINVQKGTGLQQKDAIIKKLPTITCNEGYTITSTGPGPAKISWNSTTGKWDGTCQPNSCGCDNSVTGSSNQQTSQNKIICYGNGKTDYCDENTICKYGYKLTQINTSSGSEYYYNVIITDTGGLFKLIKNKLTKIDPKINNVSVNITTDTGSTSVKGTIVSIKEIGNKVNVNIKTSEKLTIKKTYGNTDKLIIRGTHAPFIKIEDYTIDQGVSAQKSGTISNLINNYKSSEFLGFSVTNSHTSSTLINMYSEINDLTYMNTYNTYLKPEGTIVSIQPVFKPSAAGHNYYKCIQHQCNIGSGSNCNECKTSSKAANDCNKCNPGYKLANQLDNDYNKIIKSGDGSTREFTITFPNFIPSDLVVKTNGTKNSQYTITGKKIIFNSPPTNGSNNITIEINKKPQKCVPCQPGEYYDTTNSGTTCNSCNQDTDSNLCTGGNCGYTNTTGQSSCKSYRTSGKGSYISSLGTKTSDRSVTTCTKSYTKTTNATECQPWKTCKTAGNGLSGHTKTSVGSCNQCTGGTYSNSSKTNETKTLIGSSGDYYLECKPKISCPVKHGLAANIYNDKTIKGTSANCELCKAPKYSDTNDSSICKIAVNKVCSEEHFTSGAGGSGGAGGAGGAVCRPNHITNNEYIYRSKSDGGYECTSGYYTTNPLTWNSEIGEWNEDCKPYTCNTGSSSSKGKGSYCKSCKTQTNMKEANDCKECKNTHVLTGSTNGKQTCVPLSCTIGDGTNCANCLADDDRNQNNHCGISVWKSYTLYKQDNIVENSGTYYKANQNHTSSSSFNNSNWTVIGTHNPSNTYNNNDIVKVQSTSKYYKAKKKISSGTQISDTRNWNELSDIACNPGHYLGYTSTITITITNTQYNNIKINNTFIKDLSGTYGKIIGKSSFDAVSITFDFVYVNNDKSIIKTEVSSGNRFQQNNQITFMNNKSNTNISNLTTLFSKNITDISIMTINCIPWGGLCINGNLVSQQYRIKDNQCGNCDPGYYLDQSECKPCPKGTKQGIQNNTSNSGSCTPCNYGNYSGTGSASCAVWGICDAGKGRKSFYLETVLTKNSDIIQIKNMTSNTITYFQKGEKILIPNDKFTVTTGTVYLDSWSATKDGTYSKDFSTIPSSSSTLYFKTKKSSDDNPATANQTKSNDNKLHYSREYKTENIECANCPSNFYNSGRGTNFCGEKQTCTKGKGLYGASSESAGDCRSCEFPEYSDKNDTEECIYDINSKIFGTKYDPNINYAKDTIVYNDGKIYQKLTSSAADNLPTPSSTNWEVLPGCPENSIDFTKVKNINQISSVSSDGDNKLQLKLDNVNDLKKDDKIIIKYNHKITSFSNHTVKNLILDKNSSYTKGAVLSVGSNKGTVLKATISEKSVIINVTHGTFTSDSTLTSNNSADTTGTKILSISGTVKATTTANHGLSADDFITIEKSTNFNGTRQITIIDSTKFYFTAKWTSKSGEIGEFADKISNHEIQIISISNNTVITSLNYPPSGSSTRAFTSNYPKVKTKKRCVCEPGYKNNMGQTFIYWTNNSGYDNVISGFSNHTVTNTVKATTQNNHNLITGDSVIIKDSKNYNKMYQITTINVKEFYFTATWEPTTPSETGKFGKVFDSGCIPYTCNTGSASVKGTHCNTCKAQGKRKGNDDCASCYSGHVIDPPGNSERKVNNCREFTCITVSGNTTACSSCKPLNERTKDNHCRTCNPGYKIQGGKCTPYSCSTGATNTTGCKTCKGQISRNADGDCKTCHSGYYLSPDNTNSAQTCVAYKGTCTYGVLIAQEKRTQDNHCDPDNCNSGYYFDKTNKSCKAYTCSTGATNTTSCKTCKIQANQKADGDCSDCHPGYYLSQQSGNTNSQKCVARAGSCAHGTLITQSLRTQDNHCGSCNPGYYLYNKTCLPYGGSCNYGSLITQSKRKNHNHCGSCDSGYLLVNNDTNSNIQDCVKAAGICKNGKLIDFEKRTQHNHCGSCDNGFSLDKKKNTCNRYGGKCQNGKLISVPKRTKDNHCGSCNPGYYLKNDKCNVFECTTGPKNNCKECEKIEKRQFKNHCSKCNAGYKYINKQCVKTDPTCKYGKVNSDLKPDDFDGEKDQCKSCDEGYELVDDIKEETLLEGFQTNNKNQFDEIGGFEGFNNFYTNLAKNYYLYKKF